MSKVNTRPTVCNLCGGKVIYTSNSIVYGREYGSGKCYYCTECGAYVGTHEPRPEEALGILANKEMREAKMKCHEVFDKFWKCKTSPKDRRAYRALFYKKLASNMGIPVEECHFGFFDLLDLQRAYEIISHWEV